MFKIISILFILFCSKEIFCQRNDGNKAIEIHDCSVASSTQIISTTMGPCYDTPGCEIPLCCGIESGRITNISFVYISPFNVTAMTTHGQIDSIGLGVGPPDLIQIPITKVEFPSYIIAHDPNSCTYTSCPQTAGNQYRFDGVFSIPLSLVTSLTVTGNLIAELQSNDNGNRVVYCKAVYVRIVGANAITDLERMFNSPPFVGVLPGLG